jgi:hypothetical protein
MALLFWDPHFLNSCFQHGSGICCETLIFETPISYTGVEFAVRPSFLKLLFPTREWNLLWDPHFWNSYFQHGSGICCGPLIFETPISNTGVEFAVILGGSNIYALPFTPRFYKFPQVEEPPPNYGCPKGDTKLVPYWEPKILGWRIRLTVIRCFAH